MSETNKRLQQLFYDTWNREISADEAFEAAPDIEQLERENAELKARVAELEEALIALDALRGPFARPSDEAITAAWDKASKALSPVSPPAADYVMVPRVTLLTYATCLEDVATGKGGWAWEEVIGELKAMIEAGEV